MSRKNPLYELNPFKDRTPVQRRHAAQYLLITLISFAFSVGGTRLFLEIMGYPKLGGGQLHIAHVLWGGLFLFMASLLPLILINRWGLRLSALLAGFGIGLFIDEVGKFITQTNDYFYPAAAPIVYVMFLLTVLVFAQIRNNRKSSARTEMYGVLEDFEEVLDQDLSAEEFRALHGKLEQVIESEKSPELVDLAKHLKTYLEMNRNKVVPEDPGLYDRVLGWIKKVERDFLKRKRLRKIIVIGLIAWAIWALVSPVGFLLLSRDAAQLQFFIDQLISNRLVRNESGLNWFEARVLLEGGVGIFALVSAGLMMTKAEIQGVWAGIADMLVTLTLVNPLIFYFDQFSSMFGAFFHFVIFILLIRYKQRFMSDEKYRIAKSITQA